MHVITSSQLGQEEAPPRQWAKHQRIKYQQRQETTFWRAQHPKTITIVLSPSLTSSDRQTEENNTQGQTENRKQVNQKIPHVQRPAEIRSMTP